MFTHNLNSPHCSHVSKSQILGELLSEHHSSRKLLILVLPALPLGAAVRSSSPRVPGAVVVLLPPGLGTAGFPRALDPNSSPPCTFPALLSRGAEGSCGAAPSPVPCALPRLCSLTPPFLPLCCFGLPKYLFHAHLLFFFFNFSNRRDLSSLNLTFRSFPLQQLLQE